MSEKTCPFINLESFECTLPPEKKWRCEWKPNFYIMGESQHPPTKHTCNNFKLTKEEYYKICKSMDYIPVSVKPRILPILGHNIKVESCWSCPMHFTDDEQNGQDCALSGIPEIGESINPSCTDYGGFPEDLDKPFPASCPLKEEQL